MIDYELRWRLTPQGMALLEILDRGRLARLIDHAPFIGARRRIARRLLEYIR